MTHTDLLFLKVCCSPLAKNFSEKFHKAENIENPLQDPSKAVMNQKSQPSHV